ncbi:MAG: hypothetical protein KKC19_00350 [Nanoarchaeota archaeon]|nr:hypothetical protein [Nanoarchaeota archaeon]
MEEGTQKYGFYGHIEDLANAFPDLKYELKDRENRQDCIIDASEFDVDKVGRFMTFGDNNSIRLCNLPAQQYVPAVIHMFKRDGEIAVYKEKNAIDAIPDVLDNMDNDSRDPWNCEKTVLNRETLPVYAKALELRSEEEIINYLQVEDSCEIYIHSPKYRLKTRLYQDGQDGLIAYRQFGFNEKVNKELSSHESPQGLSVISPAIYELPILYNHIQFLRRSGEVIAKSRNDHICVNGNDPDKMRTGSIELKFSKLKESKQNEK